MTSIAASPSRNSSAWANSARSEKRRIAVISTSINPVPFAQAEFLHFYLSVAWHHHTEPDDVRRQFDDHGSYHLVHPSLDGVIVAFGPGLVHRKAGVRADGDNAAIANPHPGIGKGPDCNTACCRRHSGSAAPAGTSLMPTRRCLCPDITRNASSTSSECRVSAARCIPLGP